MIEIEFTNCSKLFFVDSDFYVQKILNREMEKNKLRFTFEHFECNAKASLPNAFYQMIDF